ncbi:MAG: DUF2085 domain-containing protein [Ignavibacteriae bacterium]|nr:DUF2085 domain-containing protein [Ignavibacteriota bacterium]NOG96782.1 DUF2085 domain-containing protein [Ignavibacteriota bacterium]
MKTAIHLLITVLLAFWLIGIFIEQLIPGFPFLIYLHPFLDLTYSNVCHQQPEKIIEFTGGGSTLTCARCTGIYFGTFAAALLLMFIKLKKIISNLYFIIASLLIVLDVVFYSIGLYQYSKVIAFITGLFFGSIVFYYFYYGINEYFSHRLNYKN